MIENVVKYNKKELIKYGRNKSICLLYYWFKMKDGCDRAFYIKNNNFYLGYDKIIWIKAIKFLEMIGDDWDI